MKKNNTLSAEELKIQQEMDKYFLNNKSSLGLWQEKEILHFMKLAQNQHEMTKKTKQITLRISEKDLLAIKAKAIKIGIPYQTLIWSHIHQLVN